MRTKKETFFNRIREKWRKTNAFLRGVIVGFLIGFIGHTLQHIFWLSSLYPNHYICGIEGTPSAYRCLFPEFFNQKIFPFIISLIFVTLTFMILGGIFNYLYHKINEKINSKHIVLRILIKSIIVILIVLLSLAIFSKGISFMGEERIDCWVWENRYECPSLLHYIFQDTLYFMFVTLILGGIMVVPLCFISVIIYEVIKERLKKR